MSVELINNHEIRHDFVLLFDVKDGNPNGDPDAGNLPRVDPETMYGIVTDVCLKRKIRNYIDSIKGTEDRFKIYVQHHSFLYDQQKRAYTALKVEKSTDTKHISEATQWMCDNFYDIRTFGAVMSTKEYNCGQVRGPLQFTFGRSVDPVNPSDISITRVALTKPGDASTNAEADSDLVPTHGTMGRKAFIPYGLYIARGFYNPNLALPPKGTGFDSNDLSLFWEALQKMWDHDRSASRGFMACRGIYVFSHKTKMGEAPANVLFDKIKISLINPDSPPRQFSDYEVSVESDLPGGVTLTKLAL